MQQHEERNYKGQATDDCLQSEHQSLISSDHLSGTEDDANEVVKLTKHYDHELQRWRKVVAFIFCGSALAIVYTTHSILTHQLENATKASFRLFCNTIADGLNSHFANLFTSQKELAREISAYALTTKSRFPFVTVDNFEVFAHASLQISMAEEVVFSPKVVAGQREAWVKYSVENQGWFNRSVDIFRDMAPDWLKDVNISDSPIEERIFAGTGVTIADNATNPSFPIWTWSPPIQTSWINLDIAAPPYNEGWLALEQTRDLIFGPLDVQQAYDSDAIYGRFVHQQMHDSYVNFDQYFTAVSAIQPHFTVIYPVFDALENVANAQPVGLIASPLSYDPFFVNLLPTGVRGVDIVVRTDCGDVFTYEIDGVKAICKGVGDLHDTSFDEQVRVADFSFMYKDEGISRNVSGNCFPVFYVYPSNDFTRGFQSRLALIFTSSIVVAFVAMSVAFLFLDDFVQRRYETVAKVATKTNHIVATLFPAAIRKRMMEEEEPIDAQTESCEMAELAPNRTIADLYPKATIFFADIAGFTARHPKQVFSLLETIFQSFDQIAGPLKVFKVETVGDCFVGATGIPEAMHNHASVMVEFAAACLARFRVVIRQLENKLGPDTGDLNLRVGMHSGPCVAGVLRGANARFQLFGDTMNLASRMESTGIPGRIQLSEQTAKLLNEAGHDHWIEPRDDIVKVKGKMKTFFVRRDFRPLGWRKSSTVGFDYGSADQDKSSRLIEWNTNIVAQYLNCIVLQRNIKTSLDMNKEISKTPDPWISVSMLPEDQVRKEVQPVLELPLERETLEECHNVDNGSMILSQEVRQQLRSFIIAIAERYPDNHFHCFEHASNVLLSVSKVLKRVAATSEVDSVTRNGEDYRSYGDPMVQFSCIFAALIHDVLHPGIPNDRLCAENSDLAKTYRNVSIAEQVSVNTAWTLLLRPEYAQLRKAIASTIEECKLFRHLLVNLVMATDIADEGLKAMRKERWTHAFSGEATLTEKQDEYTIRRKATIVLEYLIQASDISHTMQHFKNYQKWNARLFYELHKAYKDGRSEKNPVDYWFEGELGFFSLYIIPLARKLRDCGVFGVSCDEFLDYALSNHDEWKERGRAIVADLAASVGETVNEHDVLGSGFHL